MIPLGETLLFGAAAASASAPYVVDRLRQPAQDVSFRDSRRTDLGVADYLPYEELVEPEILLTTYGALGGIFEIVWNDTSSVSDDDRIRHAAWLNDALLKLSALTNATNGWMIQTYAVPGEAPPLALPAYLPTDARRVLAESRIAHLSTGRVCVRHFVAVTYLPPSEARAGASSLFVTGEAPVETSYEKVRADFTRGLEAFEDSIRRVGKLRRIGTHPADRTRSEFLETIFLLLYDEAQPIHIGEPFESSPIGGLLAARDISPAGLHPMVGDKHVRVLSIYSYPACSNPGLLDAYLRSLAPGCRFTTRAIFQDPAAAAKHLDHKRRAWAGQKKSLLQLATPPNHSGPPRVNRVAALREAQVEDAIVVGAVGRVAWLHFNAKVVLFESDRDVLTENIRAIRKALQGEGFTVNLESINTLDAYLGHVPFDGHHDVREGQVHTGNASRIWATGSRWPGRTSWTCKNCGPVTDPAIVGLTGTREDFAIDPHEEDSQSFLALGFPGCGKTTFLNKMAADYIRTANDLVFGIDKNFGQFVTNRFLGGDYRENDRYWLFGGLERPAKRHFLVNFLSSLVELNGVMIEQRDIFKTTLELMLADAPEHRSLSTFLNLLGPIDTGGRITAKLADYAHGGVHNGIFDGTYDPAIGHSVYEVHELGSLLRGNANELVAAPVLVWILNSFEERLAGHRSIILIDEAWAAVKTSIIANIIEELLRTLRYRHSGIGFFTHSIAEIRNSAIGKTVVGTCKTRLLFPNPDASGEFRDFYENALELTPAQINIIKNGQLKRDCTLTASGRFGPFSLPLSPAESAVYGCTSKDEVDAAKRLMIDYPDTWRERHLRAYGCHREADRLRELRRSHALHTEMLAEVLA